MSREHLRKSGTIEKIIQKHVDMLYCCNVYLSLNSKNLIKGGDSKEYDYYKTKVGIVSDTRKFKQADQY